MGSHEALGVAARNRGGSHLSGRPGDLQAVFEKLDENVITLGWVRDRLKRAIVATPPEGGKLFAVWHHKGGWIHPVDKIRQSAKAVAADELTREEVAEAMGFDLEEIDTGNARDRDRLQLGDATFYDCRLQSTLADATLQDQIAPGTWTTLPDGYEVDADPGYSFVGDIGEDAANSNPFEITDADEPLTAGIDTQASVDGKVRIDITVGGKTLTVDGSADLIKTLRDLNRKF